MSFVWPIVVIVKIVDYEISEGQKLLILLIKSIFRQIATSTRIEIFIE